MTERVQMLSGWMATRDGPFSLRAVCGGQQIVLRQFAYPDPGRNNITGFWGFLVLQELLEFIDQEFLKIDVMWGKHLIHRLHLRVSPVARELAQAYPLNLKVYPTGIDPGVPDSPFTLVFPGLGGAGGSTINLLFRLKMYREDWPFPVYSEANDARLWKKLRRSRSPARWIDGHECYHAADGLGTESARITILREPLSRMVSVFNYNSIVHPTEFPYASFEDFISSDEAERYSQAKGLMRAAGRPVAANLPRRELYALAKEELDQNYALVGFTDLFEETIFLICRLAGYQDINMWWRVLSAPSSVKIEDMSTRTRGRAERVLAADRRLYEEKKAEFRSLVTEADLGKPLALYKEDASKERPLPDSYKMIECLRWRQIISSC